MNTGERSVESTIERVFALWIPDWPVHALRLELSEPPGFAAPIALTFKQRVVACSEPARTAGVRIGMREREAQAACPEIELHQHDPQRDKRTFARVVAGLEAVVAEIETRRPGLVALRARGPARYYGGEEPAARALLKRAAELGYPHARLGAADGLFTAEQAARVVRGEGDACTIVPAGASRAFLSPLPIGRATNEQLATTLQGLGIHTLGAFAALPEESVRQRFGGAGIAAHRRAMAAGPRHGSDVRPHSAPKDLSVESEFEPPLNDVARISEAVSGIVERLFGGLAEAALVCTGLRIELTVDTGARHERTWSHPTRFAREDVLDRVRWQAESGALRKGRPTGEVGAHDSGEGVVRVRLTPTHTGKAAAHEPGLWGGEIDERVSHRLRGIQSQHGAASVGTIALSGGRLAADRQQFTPWGQTPERAASAAHPWPGAAPAPALVFSDPPTATLTDAAGRGVLVNDEDLLTSHPARLRVEHTAEQSVSPALGPEHLDPHEHHARQGMAGRVASWSSVWPVRERWWNGEGARAHLQVTLDNGEAWLLLFASQRWVAAGKYD